MGLSHTTDHCYGFSHSLPLQIWTPLGLFFLSAQLIICLASISIILLPLSSAPLPPSLRQILVCAQLFPVPIASPELRGDGTSPGSCPVMSHVCRVASKGVKRDGP